MGIVFNTDPHYKDGEHWISLFVNLSGSHLNNNPGIYYFDSFGRKPPTQIKAPTTHELFDTLERELASADVLRVLEQQWLGGEEFGVAVEARVEAFRRRGGLVEYRS